jgi:hypothetical protein
MRAQRAILVAVVLTGLVPPRSVFAEDRLIDTGRSTITVRVFKSGLLRAFADDHVVQAPLAEGTLDPATPHVQILIDTSRMRVLDPGLSAKDRQEVQARMLGPEVLDVNRYRRITYHSVTIERRDGDAWLVRGELELHGVIRALAVSVVARNGRYTGSATVRQSDFGIVPISIAGGAVTVKDEVRVDFDIVVTDQLAAAGASLVDRLAVLAPAPDPFGAVLVGASGLARERRAWPSGRFPFLRAGRQWFPPRLPLRPPRPSAGTSSAAAAASPWSWRAP